LEQLKEEEKGEVKEEVQEEEKEEEVKEEVKYLCPRHKTEHRRTPGKTVAIPPSVCHPPVCDNEYSSRWNPKVAPNDDAPSTP
jgi:hypothetical protein